MAVVEVKEPRCKMVMPLLSLPAKSEASGMPCGERELPKWMTKATDFRQGRYQTLARSQNLRFYTRMSGPCESR